MAIEPFRRRIGITSPGSLLSGNAPQIADVGPSISRAAGQIFEAYQPELRAKAVKKGQIAAGQAEIKRDEKGRALPIETPKDVGLLYQQAFEEVAQARYVSNVSLDFQSKLDAEIEAMRKGDNGKKLDAESYRAFVSGTLEGMLEVVDPSVRPLLEQTLGREAQERTRAVYGEAGQRARQDLISALNNDYARLTKLVADASSKGDIAQVANYQAQMKTLTDKAIKAGTIGEKFAGSMEEDQKVEYAEAVNNAISMRTVNEATPLILGLSGDELQIVEQRLDNVSSGGSLRKELPIFATEKLYGLSDFAKNIVRGIATDRRRKLAEEAAEARAFAAQERQTNRLIAAENATRNLINGLLSNGLGGGWDAEARGVMDKDFNKLINLAALNTPEERQKALQFISIRQYVPGPLVNFMANGIRSGDPFAALEFYNNIKIVNVGGANVGDMLLEKVDPRSRALLTAASDLMAAGQPPAIAAAYVERMRSGNAFTPTDAVSAFNNIEGDGKPGTYSTQRDKLIKRAYGIPERNPVPAALAKRVDVSYAASLDVYNRDPAIALEKAITQNKSVYTMSPIFSEGLGPSALTRSYRITDLGAFFGAAKENGKSLVPPVKGTDGKLRNHVIGKNGTIKLTPLDESAGGIGRYRVDLFDPQNPSAFIDNFEIDLGLELSKWAKGQPAVQAPNPIEQARLNRTSIERRQGAAMTNPSVAASMTGSGAP